jgi:hypothetical protein
MPDNHIAAALRAAAVCVARVECMPRYVANVEAHGTCEPGYQCICANQAAAAVAAFNQRMASEALNRGKPETAQIFAMTAAAVEQEARNDR